jgi:hypothetical protein
LAGYRDRISSTTREQAQAQLGAIVDPESLVIVIVGDYALVGAEVDALGLGPMVMLDDEGRPIAAVESGD